MNRKIKFVPKHEKVISGQSQLAERKLPRSGERIIAEEENRQRVIVIKGETDIFGRN